MILLQSIVILKTIYYFKHLNKQLKLFETNWFLNIIQII